MDTRRDIIGHKGFCDLAAAVQVLLRGTRTCSGSHWTHDVACLPQVFFCRFLLPYHFIPRTKDLPYNI